MSLDPDVVTRKSFETSFRGYDPMEVQAFLLVVADELRAYRDLELDMELRLSEAERRAREAKEKAARRLPPAPAPAPPAPSLDDLDHDEIARLIGEETARVLGSARAAADEIRAKAEAEAVAILAQAGERARARLAVAEDEATTARDTAQHLLSEVAADVDRRRAEVDDEVAQRLAAAAETADRLVADAEAHAQSLLDETTAEAEALAEAARLEADELLTVTRSESSSLIDGAKEQAHAVVTEAATDAAEIIGAAAAEADGARASQFEEARALVLEAKAYRRRTLEDLSARRHQALEQLEQLRAGRDHLADTLSEARRVLDGVAQEVDGALDGARDAAAEARARVIDAGPVAVDDLESALRDGSGGEDETNRAGAAAPPTDRREASHEEPEVVTSLFARIRADREAFIEARPLDLRSDSSDPSAGVIAGSDSGAAPTRDADASCAEDRVAETLFPPEVTGVDAPQPETAAEPPQRIDEMDDDDVRVRRDRALIGPERGLGRMLKRVLSDEQNQALDRVRSAREVPELDDLVGDAESHALRYAGAARDELRDAAYAGVTFVDDDAADGAGADETDRPVVDDLAALLAVEIVTPLRERLAICWADADGDELELLEQLRATYRQWRARVLPDIATRFVAEAFNRGLSSVDRADVERWLVPTT